MHTIFDFKASEGSLIASNNRHERIEVSPVKTDVFRSDSLFFASIRFQRDANKLITGFTVTTDGISKLEFKKIDIL